VLGRPWGQALARPPRPPWSGHNSPCCLKRGSQLYHSRASGRVMAKRREAKKKEGVLCGRPGRMDSGARVFVGRAGPASGSLRSDRAPSPHSSCAAARFARCARRVRRVRQGAPNLALPTQPRRCRERAELSSSACEVAHGGRACSWTARVHSALALPNPTAPHYTDALLPDQILGNCSLTSARTRWDLLATSSRKSSDKVTKKRGRSGEPSPQDEGPYERAPAPGGQRASSQRDTTYIHTKEKEKGSDNGIEIITQEKGQESMNGTRSARAGVLLGALGLGQVHATRRSALPAGSAARSGGAAARGDELLQRNLLGCIENGRIETGCGQ